MAHQSHAEEATKIAKETKFATLGRSIADAYATGTDTKRLITYAMELRYIEQQQIDKETAFAALTRQIGDAARNGKDIAALLDRIVALRRYEIGPTVPR
jgi:hypothetical protein